MVGADGLGRCAWAGSTADYLDYHDHEWGTPVHGETPLFERLTLEGFQSGLSWLTILRKREGFRAAFAGFDADAVARFGDRDVERLMADASIVRNRRKIQAAITNAAAVQRLRALGGLDAGVLVCCAGSPHPAGGARRRPGEHPGLGRAHTHPQGPRVRLGGADDDVRRDAGVWRGQRPRPRLPPERRMRSRFLGQVLAAYLLCRLFSFVLLTVVAGHQAPVTWTGPHPDYLSMTVLWDGSWYREIAQQRLSGAAADRSRDRRSGRRTPGRSTPRSRCWRGC